jgi:hypothetical protein
MVRAVLGFAVIFLVLLTSQGIAQPPPNANPALRPFFEGLDRPDVGGSCCGVSDCRFTQWRIGKDGYEAFVDKHQWPDVDESHWVKVPDTVVLHKPNPTGRAVLCYSPEADYTYCFLPGWSS